MQSLLIYGAGGFGREVLDIVRSGYADAYEQVAFVVDGEGGGHVRDVPVLSWPDAQSNFPPTRAAIVIAVGAPAVRARLAARVTDTGYSMATLIDPTSTVRETSSIGPGAIVCARVFVSCESSVAANVIVNANATIGHDVSLAAHCVLDPSATLLGNVKVGEGTEIGTGATVFPQISIGNWSKVAMASCVYKDVDSNVTVSGNPARVMASRDADWHLQ